MRATRCDQCEAAIINGVYCHEQGCPRERAERLAADVDDEAEAIKLSLAIRSMAKRLVSGGR